MQCVRLNLPAHLPTTACKHPTPARSRTRTGAITMSVETRTNVIGIRTDSAFGTFFRHHGWLAPGVRLFRRIGFASKAGPAATSWVPTMFVTEFLRRPRKQDATPRGPSPALAAVDIELPLAPSAPPAGSTPQQQWERVLSPAAHVWLRKLPSTVRPNHLADQFPRIANRLALVWRDCDLVEHVLDDLLIDRRGGRRGFPSEVGAELLRLHAFHERRQLAGNGAVKPLGKVWDRHLQASADR